MKFKVVSAAPQDPSMMPPEPTMLHIPEWYRGLSRYYTSNSDMDLNPINFIGTDGSISSTKMCMPYFDALTMGYVYVLKNDVYVDMDPSGKPIITWSGHGLPVDQRTMIDVPIPDNCHPVHFGWRMDWYYETPPGYSVMITHPMNRHDLPFYTLSGIVDADNWGLPVFVSFFLKRNFRGMIPRGTPIFQMIPFKRDDWELDVVTDPEELNKYELRAEKRRTDLFSHYKKSAWVRKIFTSILKRGKNE